jgi:CubicO group peptidase (beta-lactamase class C family)
MMRRQLRLTVGDLAKYSSLQFRRGPGEGADPKDRRSPDQRIHWLAGLERRWGLGWGVARRDDKVRISHGGSVPGFRTSISMVPADRFGVIVLTNAEDGRPSLYSNQAYAMIAPAIAKATAVQPETPKGDPAWQKYVGVYTWEDEEIHVAVLDGKLSMFDPS